VVRHQGSLTFILESSKEQHLCEIERFCDIKHYCSKVWGQWEFLFYFWGENIKLINTFIHQGWVKSIKSDSKDNHNVTKKKKDYISNNVFFNFLFIKESWGKKYTTLIIIIKICCFFLASNHHIKVISEGPCDPEDCKYRFDHRNKLHFKIN